MTTQQPRSLLAVFAHPDDEVFSAGGIMARAAADGLRVVLVCATRGEVGGISDPALATPETLATVREAELQAALTALGVAELRFLGYRDSGMVGTPNNDDPRSFNRADPVDATGRLVTLIREIKPDLVVTHDPTGGYGHPDHIATSRYVTAAFDAAGDANQFADAGAPWQPSRLFYAATPRSFFVQMREQMRAMGVDTSNFDNLDTDRMGYEDDQITAVVDVTDQIERKMAAFKAHRTQFGTDSGPLRMPEPILRDMLARECFIQARPEPPSDMARLDNLFVGAMTNPVV